jgi:hypothetical protein
LNAKLSSFHDESLQQATEKINGILSELKDPVGNRELAFITTLEGLLLAWVIEGDAEEVERESLGIEPPPEEQPEHD